MITTLEDADNENERVALVFEDVPAGIGGATATAELTILDSDLRFEATVSEQLYLRNEPVSLALPRRWERRQCY